MSNPNSPEQALPPSVLTIALSLAELRLAGYHPENETTKLVSWMVNAAASTAEPWEGTYLPAPREIEISDLQR